MLLSDTRTTCNLVKLGSPHPRPARCPDTESDRSVKLPPAGRPGPRQQADPVSGLGQDPVSALGQPEA